MSIEIPYVTYCMLLDALRPCKILFKSKNHPERFRWVSSIHWKRGAMSLKDMMFVCPASEAKKAEALFPGALIVLIVDPDGPDGAPPAISNPTIHVANDESSVGLMEKLQDYFISVQSWHGDLQHIAPSPNALKQVLDKSGRMIKAPLLLYGSDLEQISKALFNPNLPLCKSFVAREREILNSIKELRRSPAKFKSGRGALIVENAFVGNEKTGGLYLLALFERQPTQGEQDLFAMMTRLLESRSDLQTGRFEPTRFTADALFDGLISGRYINKGQLHDYANNLGFPLDAEFRLCCFMEHSSVTESSINEIPQPLRKVNKGKVVSVIREDRLYFLLYSKGFDNSLSNKAVEDQLLPILDPRIGFVAVSQVFDDITNVRFAHQQIDLVANHKKHLDFMDWFGLATQGAPRLCYTFEETLRFLLVEADAMSLELRDFSFSHTVLDKIIHEDAVNGGNDTRILAAYIHHERKATAVAEKLHMHRNTVLYRIGKIESRFGLDLNEGWSRNRLLFDFSILYAKLMQDPEMFRKITGMDFSDLLSGSIQNS